MTALTQFMAAPTEMTSQMHMTSVMYAPSDDFTLMGMLPYINESMKHKTRMGTRFTTRSEGFGDLRIGSLFSFIAARITG